MKKMFAILTAAVMCALVSIPAMAADDPLDVAIREASTYLTTKIPAGNKVAFISIGGGYFALSDYVLNALARNGVNDGKFTVVDRTELDAVRAELHFNMSGEVSDASAQMIGHMLGAQTIVTGAVRDVGSKYRLEVKAIEVETATVQGAWSSKDIANKAMIADFTKDASDDKKKTAVAVASPVQSALPASGELLVWSFTDEVGNMIQKYYKKSNPSAWVDYVKIETQDFPGRLDEVLASGKGVPDIICLESDFVRRYIESGQLLDLSDIYEANKEKLLSYPVGIGAYNGRVYGMSWQAAPGAMYYRRSLAKKYLGTDDPKKVQAYFTDMNKFLETAQLIQNKSKGICSVISAYNELYHPYVDNRTSRWVVNGKVVIDPKMEQYMDICKTISDKNYQVGGFGTWSGEWFESMRGELKKDGQPKEVFSYFLPTWGLPYILKQNAPKTSGDWGVIPGPLPYRWGGTWIAAYKDTPNAEAAKALISYLTTNDAFLEAWAKDTGDFINNMVVVNKIKGKYKEPFLKGQNHYAEFAVLAEKVNGGIVQKYDDIVGGIFQEEVDAYVWQGKSKQEALADFVARAQEAIAGK